MIRILSLFSGIGAFEKALERQGIEHEVVAYCEIDKYASKSYAAIHNVPESMNLGDITKVDPNAIPDFDLMTWGFPCQDISVAGNLKGIVEGETRSGLYYEGFRILKAKMPKYSIVENVKNLVGKRFKADFVQMLSDIEELGYNNYWQVLNAKDYGIPQNRERVFIVSIRKDVDNGSFVFPEKEPLELRLKDVLEREVDEKYYLSDESFAKLKAHNQRHAEKGNGFRARIMSEKDTEEQICPTIYTVMHRGDGTYIEGCKVKEATKKGYAEAEPGDSINIGQPNSKTRRGRVGKQIANTLTTQMEMAVVEPKCIQAGTLSDEKWDKRFEQNRIRKLTPKECWRLMGFDDADIEKAKDIGISNSQLYKQAGNSIVVNVLEKILQNLLKEGGNNGRLF